MELDLETFETNIVKSSLFTSGWKPGDFNNISFWPKKIEEIDKQQWFHEKPTLIALPTMISKIVNWTTNSRKNCNFREEKPNNDDTIWRNFWEDPCFGVFLWQTSGHTATK